ncbi:MAG: hypothetical protein ACHRXM_01390 [Isosphaerales bacterium]
MDGLPAGSYRVRALDLFGRVTFAAGVAVRPGWTAAQDVRLWSKVDLDEPESRQVMGFVKWESGLPAVKAGVFLQNTYNFRKYVRRVETDDQGFFRFLDVPGNEPYFVFAAPPGEDRAMRSFDYFGVGFLQREVWRELTLHPHRVTGSLIGADPKSILQLVLLESRDQRVLWSFSADDEGLFAVANVPHGRYRVQATSKSRGESARSLPFEIGDGKEVLVVRWPELMPK